MATHAPALLTMHGSLSEARGDITSEDDSIYKSAAALGILQGIWSNAEVSEVSPSAPPGGAAVMP